MPFNRLSQPELRPLLENPTDDDAKFILHLAQGCPGMVVTLRNDPDALREQRLMHSKASSFWRSGSLRERLQLLQPVMTRGDEADQFLIHLALTLREDLSASDLRHAHRLVEFSERLESNANRQLQCQKFVLGLHG